MVTPKAVVGGPQTAVVVGKEGEELGTFHPETTLDEGAIEEIDLSTKKLLRYHRLDFGGIRRQHDDHPFRRAIEGAAPRGEKGDIIDDSLQIQSRVGIGVQVIGIERRGHLAVGSAVAQQHLASLFDPAQVIGGRVAHLGLLGARAGVGNAELSQQGACLGSAKFSPR